jgi:phage baseplate assembly protein W
MAYTVTGEQVGAINFAPKTLAEEVLQNISMILSTPQYTVPLDRRFGLSPRFLDKPLAVAQALIVSEVLDAVERYEPRAEILNVSFEESELAGRLLPAVEVKINAG